MSNPFGNYTVIGPVPGSFMAGKANESRVSTPPQTTDEEPLDPRVMWANRTGTRLKGTWEKQNAGMRRNMDLYRGIHWQGAGSRPKWKYSGKINYTFYVPEQWAAILADNKPKASYATYRRDEQPEADIMTAAWEDIYTRDEWQRKIEDAIKLSRIMRKSYLRVVYDPFARQGKGDPSLSVVSGLQVWVNEEATSVDNATLLLYEYVETLGTVYARWPRLKGRLRTPSQQGASDMDESQSILAPPASQTVNGVTTHSGPYNATPGTIGDHPSGGIVVREFWMRPRGPEAQVEVDRIVWLANNKPATTQKMLTFEGGRKEPLQTVVLDNGVVYELPMSTVEVIRYCQTVGGPKVLSAQPALRVVKRKTKVSKYPAGRRLIVVQNEVADDGANPFSHGEWPFIEVDAYRDPTKFIGISDIDQIAEMQEFLNRLYSIFLDAAILTANPIWRIPTTSDIADEDITNAPGAVQREDPLSLKIGRREKGPEMPAYLFQLLGFTISQIREISGLTEVATGGKFKGQQAAETVSMYQEAAGVRFRQGIRNVEQAIVKLGRQFAGIVAQFYTEPRMVKIRHASGIDQPVSFVGTRLTASMQMVAKSGSMLPTSPSARLNMLMEMASTPFVDIPEILRAMQEFGLIESATAMEARLERYVANPHERWKSPGLMAMFNPGPKKAAGRKKAGSRSSKRTKAMA